MKNKKIILTLIPPFWPNLPPLGIASLHEFLQLRGISVTTIDYNNVFFRNASQELKEMWQLSCNRTLEENMFSLMQNDFPELFASLIENFSKADYIAFSCFKSNFETTLRIAEVIKKETPTVKMIFGGPEMARLYFKTSGDFTPILHKYANFIIVGEGELPLASYLSGSWEGPKIALFNEVKTLNSLPFPRFASCNLSDYPRTKALPILFSRGCIKNCHFCSERLLYKQFRTRSVQNIINEITYRIKTNNISQFIFFDSLINANLTKLDQLCSALIDNCQGIQWEAQMYIRKDMSFDLLKKIKQSGCYHLFVGLESGCTKTLERMNKGFSQQDALDFFSKLHDADLSFGISLIVGYPGESDEDFENCLEFIIKNKALIPKIEQVNPFTYYEGTNTDKAADYTLQNTSLDRLNRVIETLKREKIKYTKAYIGNLVDADHRESIRHQ